MRYFLIYFFLLANAVTVYGQSTNQNFVLSRTFKQTGAAVNDVSKVNIQVQYLDGLGRPSQTVSVGQSTAGTDLVIPIEYDVNGRQPKNYLPYAVDNIANGNGKFQTGAAAAQAGFYDPSKAAVLGLESADMGRLYQETVFEASPAARTLSLQAPGNKSRSSNFIHGTNAASEVKLYRYAANADILQTISTNSSYEAAALYRVQTSDDQNNISVEFTDKAGRIVCKKVIASGTETLATYYVYDDYGLLRAVLQPQYQEEANAANFAFLYDYDERGRVITKQVPGAGKTDIAYDNFDRLVLSQDANQRVRGVWAFTKYDRVNRPVMTGEYASASSRSDLQTALNASTAHHETTDGSTVGYTLNATLPAVAEADVLNVTYYDNYSFPGAQAYVNALAVSTNAAVKSQQTGGRTKMLVAGSAWLVSTVHYDAEYRPVQTVRQLHDLGAITTERVSIKYKYDLAAVVDQQKTDHESSAGTIVNSLLKTFEYDHADRLLSVKEKVVIGSTKTKEATTLAQRYNMLGQLRSKWFHAYNAGPTKYRRRTDYVNNTRGWVTTAKTWYQQTAGTDLAFYGLSIAYNNPLYAAQYSNGNISSMLWSGKDTTTFTKGLSFVYDGANRLKTSSGLGGYVDTEGGITYDLNGNIKTLKRAGNAVDMLTYSYTGTGNRLGSVTDASPGNKGVKSGTSSYVYDANGNMTGDGNRGATLTYNYLNLPKTIGVGGKTLSYDYDAGGNKHKYVADTLIIKYAGAFEYDANNVVKRVATSEGQLVPSGDTLRFDYSLKNHLGNVRVVFSEKGDILQKSDYYPFGLSISRDGAFPANARNGINRYLFNDKELQVGSGYLDYGARMYMPEIGRWVAVDPLGNKTPNLTSFNFVDNNPINMIDPDGRSGESSIDKQNKTITISSNLIFYGGSANSSLAKSTAKDIQDKWNAAGGKTKIGGVDYTIKFSIVGKYNDKLTKADVDKNTDIKNNFIRVEDTVEGGISYMDEVGANSGYFLLKNISGDGSTTEGHEFGHGFGLEHPSDLDLRGKGQPGIMYPRGTIVDPEYQYNANAIAGAAGGTVNPEKRKVSQSDINNLKLNKIQYNSNGKGNPGKLTNVYHEKTN